MCAAEGVFPILLDKFPAQTSQINDDFLKKSLFLGLFGAFPAKFPILLLLLLSSINSVVVFSSIFLNSIRPFRISILIYLFILFCNLFQIFTENTKKRTKNL